MSDNALFLKLSDFLKSQRELDPSEILMKNRNRLTWIQNNLRIAANDKSEFSPPEVAMANENLRLLGQGFKPRHEIRPGLDAGPKGKLNKEPAQVVQEKDSEISGAVKPIKTGKSIKQKIAPPSDYHEMLKQVLNNPDIQESHAHDEWHKLKPAEQDQVHQALKQWRQTQKPQSELESQSVVPTQPVKKSIDNLESLLISLKNTLRNI